MISKSSSLLCWALLLAFCSVNEAFNITRLLGQYPELGLFNQFISDSKLVEAINHRQTITILAVDNASISAISGRSKDAIKAIISTHVILDYYDEKKLMNLKDDSAQLTTLYQSSGLAVRQQGFLNVAIIGEGEIAFGSAVHGAPVNVELMKTVATQPYNVSVLQVSAPIIPPGIDAQSPWPAPGAKTPLPSKKPRTEAPAPDEVVADSPEEAEGPAEGPAEGDVDETEGEAPGPAKEEKAADDDVSKSSLPPPPSSSTRIQMGLVGAVMCLASLLALL